MLRVAETSFSSACVLSNLVQVMGGESESTFVVIPDAADGGRIGKFAGENKVRHASRALRDQLARKIRARECR